MENIVSLTDFKRNAADIVKRVKDEKTPAVLTVNGAASVVVMDTAVYQQILRDAQAGAMMRGIEAGLKSMSENRGVSLDEAFDMLKSDIDLIARRQG